MPMGCIDLFDGHCDTLSRRLEEGGGLWENDGHMDLKRTRKFHRYAQFFAIFGDKDEHPDLPLWELCQRQYALFQKELKENGAYLIHCRTGAEARSAFQSGRTAAFLSVEGAELIDCDLGRLEQAHAMGVRAVNLTWNHANALSGSNAEEPDRGLTERGRTFVRRMEELGMLVDVSHLSDPGFWDVVAMAKKPFIASHSNARAIFPAGRNLTDGQFTAIIEHHGVAGLNMYSAFLGEDPDIDMVVSHLEHFLALGGEKSIALGGDWDGISAMPRGLTGIGDMDRLYERLLQKNYHEALVRGVFFENLMRVVNEVCTM
ncbi:Renal dipeptidase family protein [uncultured Eubacteriales bacterium]|uniref:Renal dipeptidase family protein n=1 Tax=uncultured Eubacteriales bacterium TaxID=172733 RepID=A0A212JZ37_9FIRM|nr:Renal dipeptidase family protein [uncultured Eubacteriales bacterium]